MRAAVKVVFVIVILLSSNSILQGQNYYFQQYSLEEGLPQSQVQVIMQDSRGLIWLGTNGGGLCRFNGKKFETYTNRDGLSGNVISSIFEDHKGNLWIGSNTGITIYDGIHFKKVYFDSLNALSYGNFTEDDKGDIYFRGEYINRESEIYQYNGKSFQVLNGQLNDLKGKNIRQILMADHNRLLITTDKEIYELSNGRLSESTYSKLSEKENVSKIGIFQDRKKNIWIAVNDNGKIIVYECRGDEIKKIVWPDQLNPSEIVRVYNDSKGNYWISDREGKLFQFYGEVNNGIYKLYSKANGLPGEIITSITEDNEGNLWLGTNGAGLIKFGGSKFITFDKLHGLGDNIIWSIYQDSKGIYWFGTSLSGITRYDGKNFKTFQKKNGRTLGAVRMITQAGNGNLLIGDDSGLWEFDGNSFKNVCAEFGLPGDNIGIICLIKDHNSYWIGTAGEGLFHYSGGLSTEYSLRQGNLINNIINDVLRDNEGNIWVATAGGINILKDKKVINCSEGQGLGNRNIMQITSDNAGNMWVASFGGGISRITLTNNDSLIIKNFDSRDGITSDNIYSILTDRNGNIWAGCQNGVDKIVIDSAGNILSVRNYDKHEGFVGIENNSDANFIDKDGKLWFGTIKGVMVYNPQVDVINTKVPETSITMVKLFYSNVDWENSENAKYTKGITPWNNLPINLRLPYNKNHLSFDFEGLSFRAPEKVQYQWKLEGVDKDWSPVTQESEVIYSNLNPGNYTFYVKASNNDGVWNSTPASYSFIILSPFWQSWWFRALAFVFLVSLTVIVFWIRHNMIREKQEELEQLVAFKTKKLEDQKNEIQIQRDKLEHSYQNLELLSKIGREITANLTIEAIIESVYHRLNNLMDASVLGLGIVEYDNAIVNFPVLINNGIRMDSMSFSLDDQTNFATACVRKNHEIVINNYFEEYRQHQNDWIKPNRESDTCSIIYMPLNNEKSLLGVLTVQSYRENAFQEYHLHIIRNLAVYARIALENARTYEKIQEQKNKLTKANSDITRQKEEIEKKNIELVELNDEKSHIISIVAHDLRNPLTSALTMTGLIKSEVDPRNEDQAIYTQAIEKSLNRMNEMILRLLDIRKLEERAYDIKLERINLEKIISEINKNMKVEFERKRITINLESEELYANLDRDFATQIFENLLSNAIKFSPPDTRVHVRLKKENGFARAEIRDEGPGFTQDDMKKIFGKFQRLSARPTGGEHSTGLGLSIVKKYVEAMNGKVWCESEPGKGASFIVEFERA